MSSMQMGGLRETLPLVFESKARIADHFFEAMFRHAPETRAYFTDGFGQKKSILAMLIVKVVQSAERPEMLDQIAHGLLETHRVYSITPEQYHAARLALDEALTVHLSGRISGKELGYWTKVADTLVQRMIDLAS